MNTQRKHLFDNPRNVKKLLRYVYAICFVLVLADLVFHRHVLHAWESLPVFYAIFGFVACVVLVITAKYLRKLVMRDEDYYDQPSD